MISIAVPNYNGEKFLPMCLDSLLNQTYQDFEIIVVDNASADKSCDLIREKYPRVKLVEMGYNSGFSVAVNRAIKESTGEYFALFNNDAEADSRWLESLINAMESDETTGICASKVMTYFNRDVFDSAGIMLNKDGFAKTRGYHETDTGNFNTNEFVFGASGAAAMYRMKMLREIALDGEIFDEDFFMYQEDTDVNIRSLRAGYRCLYVPEAVVYHIGSATSKSVQIVDSKPVLDSSAVLEKTIDPMSKFVFFYNSGNILNYIIKSLPACFLLKNLWRILLAELYHGFFFSIKKGYLATYFSSRWRVLQKLPTMLRKRKMINENSASCNKSLFSQMTG